MACFRAMAGLLLLSVLASAIPEYISCINQCECQPGTDNCVLSCTPPGCVATQIVCPTGAQTCDVQCVGKEACKGMQISGGSTLLTVECAGTNACEGVSITQTETGALRVDCREGDSACLGMTFSGSPSSKEVQCPRPVAGTPPSCLQFPSSAANFVSCSPCEWTRQCDPTTDPPTEPIMGPVPTPFEFGPWNLSRSYISDDHNATDFPAIVVVLQDVASTREVTGVRFRGSGSGWAVGVVEPVNRTRIGSHYGNWGWEELRFVDSSSVIMDVNAVYDGEERDYAIWPRLTVSPGQYLMVRGNLDTGGLPVQQHGSESQTICVRDQSDQLPYTSCNEQRFKVACSRAAVGSVQFLMQTSCLPRHFSTGATSAVLDGDVETYLNVTMDWIYLIPPSRITHVAILIKFGDILSLKDATLETPSGALISKMGPNNQDGRWNVYAIAHEDEISQVRLNHITDVIPVAEIRFFTCAPTHHYLAHSELPNSKLSFFYHSNFPIEHGSFDAQPEHWLDKGANMGLQDGFRVLPSPSGHPSVLGSLTGQDITSVYALDPVTVVHDSLFRFSGEMMLGEGAQQAGVTFFSGSLEGRNEYWALLLEPGANVPLVVSLQARQPDVVTLTSYEDINLKMGEWTTFLLLATVDATGAVPMADIAFKMWPAHLTADDATWVNVSSEMPPGASEGAIGVVSSAELPARNYWNDLTASVRCLGLGCNSNSYATADCQSCACNEGWVGAACDIQFVGSKFSVGNAVVAPTYIPDSQYSTRKTAIMGSFPHDGKVTKFDYWPITSKNISLQVLRLVNGGGDVVSVVAIDVWHADLEAQQTLVDPGLLVKAGDYLAFECTECEGGAVAAIAARSISQSVVCESSTNSDQCITVPLEFSFQASFEAWYCGPHSFEPHRWEECTQSKYGNFFQATECTFFCPNDMELIGSSSVLTCTADNKGSWDFEEPSCIPRPVVIEFFPQSMVWTKHVDSSYQGAFTGGTVEVISSSPPLPPGLSLHLDGSISGAPTTLLPLTSFLIRANNSRPSFAQVQVNITVVDQRPPSFTIESFWATVNTTLVNEPAVQYGSGGAVVSWSVDPPLPQGLTQMADGSIYGVPSVLLDVTVVATAVNTGGITTHTFMISIADRIPEVTYPAMSAVRGTFFSGPPPNSTGGRVLGYSFGSEGLPSELQVDTETGVISGIAQSVPNPPQTRWSISAWNSGGSVLVEIELTIVPAPIVSINYQSVNFTLVRKDRVDVHSIVGGDAPSYWSATPPLPSGLQVDATTGTLSGAPSLSSDYATFTIKGEHYPGATGTDVETTTIGITVLDIQPTDLTLLAWPLQLWVNQNVAVSPSYSGDPPRSWSVVPDLPDGLILDGSGLIYGTPTTETPAAEYTLSASNTGGSATDLMFSFSVVLAPPRNVVYEALKGSVGTFMSVLPSFDVMPDAAAPQHFQVAGNSNLPYPFTLSNTTGEVQGTPSTENAEFCVSIRASNSGGDAGPTPQLCITVTAVPPQNISYSPNPAAYKVGVALTASTPTYSGGNGNWRVNTLPAGLSQNEVTGAIEGNPTKEQTLGHYDVDLSNSGGIALYTLWILVYYDTFSVYQPARYTVNERITPNLPFVSNGTHNLNADYWSLNALPGTPELSSLGLGFNSTTGAITGTPNQMISVEYQVTATVQGKSVYATLMIDIVDAIPSFQYRGGGFVWVLGGPIAPEAPILDPKSGSVSEWSVDAPPEISSLLINGTWTGTPTELLPEQSFTVTGINDAGQGVAQVSITIIDHPPLLNTSADGDLLVRLGDGPDFDAATLFFGGAGTSWSIEPTLPVGFLFSETTGRLSGTAVSLSPRSEYNITATNTGGDSWARIYITVTEVPPIAIAYLPKNALGQYDYTLVLGVHRLFAAQETDVGGAGAWTVDRTLPAGLFLDPLSGQISGTPNALQVQTSFQVSVANTGGTKQLNITIAVVDVAPTKLVYHGWLDRITKGVPMSPMTPSFSGGPCNFTSDPSLPEGITFNYQTGAISGTPTGVRSSQVYIVTAQNTGGQTFISLVLTVVDTLPQISYLAMYQLRRGEVADAIVPDSTGGVVVTWSCSPQLAAGLTFDPLTGVIAGTPSGFHRLRKHTITVINSGGSIETSLDLEILDFSPVLQAYLLPAVNYTKDEQADSNFPVLSGGAVTLWVVTPQLPTGLFLSSVGVIRGFPTLLSVEAEYTVKAENSGGFDEYVVSVGVIDQRPRIEYSATYSMTKGTFMAIEPADSGGQVVTWTLEGVLPSGLTFQNGAISGTPGTIVDPPASLTVTATNTGGDMSSNFKIAVGDFPITNLNYLNMQPTYYVTQPISALTPTWAGGQAFGFSISPTLPSGLSLDAVTGVISGTPNVPTQEGEYTVRVTAIGQSPAMTSLWFGVIEVPPTALGYPNHDLRLTLGVTAVNEVPSVEGGGLGWASDTLPAGLLFDTASGAITGTASELSETTPYSITVSNSGGVIVTEINITVVDVAPGALSYSPNILQAIVNKSSWDLSPIHFVGGGPIVQYLITPPPPVSFSASTGQLVGVPQIEFSETVYTIEARNTGGSVWTTLALTASAKDFVLFYTNSVPVYTRREKIPHNSPSIVGLEFTYSGKLPVGLAFDGTTGLISGTPTELSDSPIKLSVTATTEVGELTCMLSISVVERSPRRFAMEPDRVSATIFVPSQSLPVEIQSDDGGPVVYYTIDPALPTGMSLDLRTGEISGFATSLFPNRRYSVFARNSGGASVAYVHLEVVDVPPDNLLYSQLQPLYTKHVSIADNIPSVEGGAVTHFQLSSEGAVTELPVGLRLDPATGFIQGTPLVTVENAYYVVEAVNSGGSASVVLRLSVIDLPPTNLFYQATNASYRVNTAITANAPRSDGGAITQFFLVSPLPPGLLMDPDTGVIDGTPTTQGLAVVDIRATNTGGSTSTRLYLTVDHDCSGVGTCNSHGICTPEGLCGCDKGFAGATCDTCAPNWYAYPNCVKCMAADTCSGRGVCLDDGQCECFVGVKVDAGQCSEECEDGYWGPACEPCLPIGNPCNGVGICRSDDGVCECGPTFGGAQCQFSNDQCSGHGQVGDDGSCICDDSRGGADCSECATDYYYNAGSNACLLCTRHTTCSGHGTCNGDLCECDDGWKDSMCSTCVSNCASCEKLDCGLNNACVNGICICNHPFTGPHCAECLPGFWGLSCTSSCGDCNSHGFCDPAIGCVCEEGYAGTRCDAPRINSIHPAQLSLYPWLTFMVVGTNLRQFFIDRDCTWNSAGPDEVGWCQLESLQPVLSSTGWVIRLYAGGNSTFDALISPPKVSHAQGTTVHTFDTSGFSAQVEVHSFSGLHGNVTLGGVAVNFTTSPGVLYFNAGPGTGTQELLVSTPWGSASMSFVRSPPLVEDAATTAGPLPTQPSSGTLLTVQGKQFGVVLDNVNPTKVTIDGNDCPVVTLTSTTLLCTLPAGQGRQRLVVDVSGSTVEYIVTYAVPSVGTVRGCAADNGFGTTGCNTGDTLTITGFNFGFQVAASSSTDSDLEVFVGGKACSQLTMTVDHTELQCRAPKGRGAQRVHLLRGPQTSLSSRLITFSGPVIDDVAIQPAVLESEGGTIVTIGGSGFWTMGGLQPVVTLGPLSQPELYSCPLRIAATDTVLECTAPAGVGRALRVSVTFDSQTTSLAPDYLGCFETFPSPTLQGGTLRMQGWNVDTCQAACMAYRYFSLVAIGKCACGESYGDVASTPKCGSMCTTGDTSGFCGAKDLYAVYAVAADATLLQYNAPIILSSTLTRAGNVPEDGLRSHSTGDLLEFDAQHIGLDMSLVSVYFKSSTSVPCALISLVPNGTSIRVRCRTATASVPGVYVHWISAGGLGWNQLAEGEDAYSVAGPPHGIMTLSSAGACSALLGSLFDCPPGGFTLIIDGYDFGNRSYVTVGGALCPNLVYVDDQQLECTPAGQGEELEVAVYLGGVAAAYQPTVSYQPPTVSGFTAVSGCVQGPTLTGCPREGGGVISVHGDNFGDPPPLLLISGNPCTDVVASAGGVQCTLGMKTATLQGTSSIAVFTPGGAQRTPELFIHYAGCPAGSFAPACTPCPAGKSAMAGDPMCQDCVQGRWSAGNAGNCSLCLPGEWSPPGSASCQSCEVGRYHAVAGLSLAFCEACPRGKHGLSGGMSCQECLPGFYQDKEGQGACKPCTVGRQSTQFGATQCDSCTTGTGQCTTCVPGKFSATAGTLVCADAPPGFFAPSDNGSHAPNPVPLPCSSGSSSAGLAALCTPCVVGATSAQGQACMSCSAGLVASPETGHACVPCATGDASDAGGEACLACVPGRFGNMAGSPLTGDLCLPCEIGKSQIGFGAARCNLCPPGQFADTTALAECIPCPAGTQSGLVEGATICSPCMEGSYAPSPGFPVCLACPPGRVAQPGAKECSPCDPGYFAGPASAVCEVCSAGWASPGGASACEPCGLGSYSNASASSSCSLCRPGMYQNNVKQDHCKPCQLNSATSAWGSGQCTPCEPGWYTDAESALQCERCPQGTLLGEGMTKCQMCSGGKFGPATAQTKCLECSPGKVAYGQGAQECTKCSKGKYQDQFGETVCINCPAGRAASVAGMRACQPCERGTKAVETGLRDRCTSCAPGEFGSDTSQCAKCPPGRFQDQGRQMDCLPCAAGRIAPVYGQSECDACPMGRYQPGDAQTECLDCSKGTYSELTGLAQCVKCAPGFWSDDPVNTPCTPCEPGTSSATGSTTCVNCIAGSFAYSRSPVCSKCAAGTFSSKDKAGSCQPCAPGWYQAEEAANACRECPKGRFAFEYGTTLCGKCEPGTYAEGQGNTGCRACAPGGSSEAESDQCTTCGLGKASDQGKCVSCEKGYYADEQGLTACKACVPGTIQTESGQSSCSFCESGTFSAEEAQNVACTVCPSGQYSNNSTGFEECLDCPPGYFQINAGQGECEACPAGTYSSGAAGECIQCPPATVSVLNGSASCTPCGFTAEANLDRTTCVCRKGYYEDDRAHNSSVVTADAGALQCEVCFPGANCGEPGTRFSAMRVKAGWWRPTATADAANYHHCLRNEHCRGGAQSACQDGRRGPICGACVGGHTPTSNGGCPVCLTPAPIQDYLSFAGLVCMFILGVCVLYVWMLKKATSRKLTQLMKIQDRSDGQTNPRQRRAMEVVHDFYQQNPQILTETQQDRLEVIDGELGTQQEYADGIALLDKEASVTHQLKLCLGFLQLAMVLAFHKFIPWPTGFKSFLLMFSFLNVDFMSSSGPQCVHNLDFFELFIAKMCLPWILIFGLCVFYGIPKLFRTNALPDGTKKTDSFRRLGAKLRKLGGFTLFLCYPLLSRAVSEIFACTEVEGDWFVTADFNMRCDDPRWWNFAIVGAVCFLLYPIGIPLFFLLRLARIKHNFDSMMVRFELGFLYEVYAREVWYFEIVDMLHKACLTALLPFIPMAWQMPAGMFIVTAYLVLILLGNPYISDKRHDQTHLLAQICLLLVLLAGWVYQNLTVLDSFSDWVMSFFLIADLTLFALVFLMSIGTRFKGYMMTAAKLFRNCCGAKPGAAETPQTAGLTALDAKTSKLERIPDAIPDEDEDGNEDLALAQGRSSLASPATRALLEEGV